MQPEGSSAEPPRLLHFLPRGVSAALPRAASPDTCSVALPLAMYSLPAEAMPRTDETAPIAAGPTEDATRPTAPLALCTTSLLAARPHTPSE